MSRLEIHFTAPFVHLKHSRVGPPNYDKIPGLAQGWKRLPWLIGVIGYIFGVTIKGVHESGNSKNVVYIIKNSFLKRYELEQDSLFSHISEKLSRLLAPIKAWKAQQRVAPPPVNVVTAPPPAIQPVPKPQPVPTTPIVLTSNIPVQKPTPTVEVFIPDLPAEELIKKAEIFIKEEDYKNAYAWLERAGLKGSTEADFKIGELFRDLLKVYELTAIYGEKRIEISRKHYNRAIQAEYFPALVGLAKTYEADLQTKRKLLQQAADKGVPQSYDSLADMLRAGQGGPANLEKAREYYQKAIDADINVYGAHDYLAEMWLQGEGGPKDAERARQLAEDPKCKGVFYEDKHQNLLARIYTEKKDYKKAEEIYKKAIDKNLQFCHSGLADLYYEGGNGIDKDLLKAREFYEKATKVKHEDRTTRGYAYYRYGLMLINGEGGNVDKENGEKAIATAASTYQNKDAQNWIASKKES